MPACFAATDGRMVSFEIQIMEKKVTGIREVGASLPAVSSSLPVFSTSLSLPFFVSSLLLYPSLFPSLSALLFAYPCLSTLC